MGEQKVSLVKDDQMMHQFVKKTAKRRSGTGIHVEK